MPDLTYNAKVYMAQGASQMVVASGGTIKVEPGGTLDLSTAVGTITFATGEIQAADLAGKLASGSVDLGPYLFAARELSSGDNFASGSTAPAMFFEGVLGVDTSPGFSNLTSGDQTFALTWASNNTDSIKLPPIAMPADFSTAGGIRIDVLGESIGTGTASDAIAALNVRAWSGIGGANVGATHPDFTSTPSYKTVSLSTGNLSTGVLNITLTPAAHAGRPIRIFGMRVRYTRSS